MPTSSIGIGRTHASITAWEAAQGALSGVHLGEIYNGSIVVQATDGGEFATFEEFFGPNGGASGSSTDGTSFVTQDYAFKRGFAYLLVVGGVNDDGAPDVSGVSGPTGTVWEEVAGIEHTGDDSTLHLFRCVPTADAYGTLTVTFSSTADSFTHILCAIPDEQVPLGSNGAEAILQVDTDQVTAGTSITGSLAAMSDVSNAVLVFTLVEAYDVTIGKSGWAGINRAIADTPGQTIAAHIKQGGSTTPDASDWTAAGSNNGLQISIELANAGGILAGGVTIAGQTGVSSSNYLKLAMASGYEHGGKFNGGGAVINNHWAGVSGHVFDVDTDYCRFEGLEVTRWWGSSAEAFRVDGNHCRFERVLMHRAADINADGIFPGTSGITVYVQNCFFGWLGRTSFHVQGDKTGTAYINNCTAIYMTGLITDNYVGMGCDLADGPLSSYTFHIKNTYVHVFDSSVPCFAKTAAADWGNSTHNASSDATASGLNATNYQNNAAIDDQIKRSLTLAWVSENGDADFAGSTEDAYIDTGNSGTNYGSNTALHVDDSDKNTLIRFRFDQVPMSARIRTAFMNFFVTTAQQFQMEWFKVLRNWTEGGVTWDDYDGTNPWTTGGALGSGDIYDDGSVGGLSAAPGLRSCSVDAAIGNNEWWRGTGGVLFPQYVQDAIDGVSRAAKGEDWIDILIDWLAGGTGTLVTSSNDETSGKPEVEIWYDAYDEPVNPSPVAGGVLDGNGTDLSADAYPVTVDIAGETRSAWDIGAYLETEDVRVTQAAAEVLLEQEADIRVTQAAVEALLEQEADIRVTQAAIEVLLEQALEVALDAIGAASSSASAKLTLRTPHAATGTSGSAGTAKLTAVQAAAATGASQSSGVAALSARQSLASAGDALSAGSALVHVTRGFRAAGDSLSAGRATLGVGRALKAAGSASSTGSAALVSTQALAAAACSVSAGSASLSATQALAVAGASLGMGVANLTVLTPYLDQHSFRWALDDAAEGAATWAAPIGATIIVTTGDRRRVRILVDAIGNPGALGARLQYRRKDIADPWRDVEVCE